ncbi:CoA-acylating methylmalonate-semialdehyde dehydrogenase [Tomitella gaofuii]|uniref:CoA-acylating methylmalonate-semialdehyde dehydrogenase n=1 Tax=Tomitella gaofuii TaxID=2760083 RepID=UPI0015F93B68|nr:CoA-acylating methylmalonate-semialdehyde dehydrogenase [Tomitella gaofuii]
MRTITHWINGTAVDGTGAVEVENPATDSAVATAPMADAATIDTAVSSGLKAFEGWSQTPQSRRVHVLFKARDLLLEHRDELAALISEEHGKTLDDAAGEVTRAVDSIELACGGPAQLRGATSLQTGPSIDTKSVLHPLGVCVGITPFNFPAMMGLMMMSVALAAGNTFVWKPSEQDPGVCVRIAELFSQAGLPDGVLNVVHGGVEASQRLIDSPDTEAVSFVGSSDVAQVIYERAAAAGKRVQAFGGAKNHLVVMPDADLEVTADQLTAAAFGAAGQRCMAISVAVVVGPTAEPLLERLAERARNVVVGAGSETGVEVGPVVSRRSQQRVQQVVRDAVAAGARAVVDRSAETVPGYESGYFVGPTLLTDVDVTSPVYTQELFAPVLVVLRVDTLDEALELIRSHRYGNGASIFTQNGAAANEFERRVTAGMVGVNVAIPVPVAAYAVQGWKASAFGDTGLNNASWSFYTRPKYVTSRWESVRGQDFGFNPN